MRLNNIYCGDSNHLIKAVKPKSVSLIASDIPYGISFANWDVLYHNTNSALGGESKAQHGKSLFKRRGKPLNGWSKADKKIPYKYQEWCSKWASEWLRVLKPGASCFIFAGRRYANRCINALQDVGFTFKDELAWDKGHAACRAQHISSVLNRRHDIINAKRWSGWRLANLRPEFEPILWFQKPYELGATITNNVLKYGVGAWNEKALEKYNISPAEPYANIIKVAETKTDHIYHKAQKPLNLMKLLIALTTKPKQLVIDPFVGSGTTCVASKQLNRKYLGFEINRKYVDISKKRLNTRPIVSNVQTSLLK